MLTPMRTTEGRNTLAVTRATGPKAPGPPWNPDRGGVAINAQPSLPQPDPDLAPPAGATTLANIDVEFVGRVPGSVVPLKVTLLDGQRQADSSRLVEVRLGAQPWQLLVPEATLEVPVGTRVATVQLSFLGTSGVVQDSCSFFLVFDAGVEYGRNEFWLDVWNP